MDYVHGTVLHPFLDAETLSAEQVAAARGNLEIVDKALKKGPFLLGGQLTLADLFLAPIHRRRNAGGEAKVKGRPGRCHSHPSTGSG